MQRENASEENNEVTPQELTEDTSEKLSLRDALEVAIKAAEDDTSRPSEDRSGDPRVADQATAAPDAGRDNASVQAGEAKPEPLQPPAEFTAEEKADFVQLSRTQQEAQLRLHRSRMSRLSEIKEAAAELQWAKDLVKNLEPFAKARGAKGDIGADLQKALEFWRVANEDRKKAAAALLKSGNIPVPKELLEQPSQDPALSPLHEKINHLESRIAEEDRRKAAEQLDVVRSALSQTYDAFSGAKNAAGTARFPDIQPDKGEAGIRMLSEIGSLLNVQTPVGQDFVQRVRARNPTANLETLMFEAYRYLGGRIDDSQAPKTQSPQNHLHKSNRAASSVPGRGTPASSTQVRRFKDTRDAYAAALAELNGE